MSNEKHIAAINHILELTVVLNEDMNERLAREGLTGSRTTLLWTLRRLGPTTQRVLADALGVSARTVTGLVDGLEATGFVRREPHPTDRRATLVTFTKQGLRVVEAMEAEQEEFAELLFGDMSRRRFDAFVSGLAEIVTKIKAHAAQIQLEEHR